MFTQDTLATVGAQSSTPPTIYSYASEDALADVTMAGYFEDKQHQFEEGDWIFAALSDGHALLEVDTDTSTVSLIILAASGFVKQTFSSGGTINSDTNLALSTGTHTLVMPTTYVGILETKSISGIATLDLGTNTMENGNSVPAGSNRRFNLDGTVWVEL